MNPLLIAVLLAGPSGFHASDRAPLNADWSRFMSYRRSQSAWTTMLVSLGRCMDRALCLGPGERILEVDTPPGYPAEAIVAFIGRDSHSGRLLVELPVELTGDETARTYLAVFQGEPDSLIIIRRGAVIERPAVTLREKKR